jgi:hypothetical protein
MVAGTVQKDKIRLPLAPLVSIADLFYWNLLAAQAYFAVEKALSLRREVCLPALSKSFPHLASFYRLLMAFGCQIPA